MNDLVHAVDCGLDWLFENGEYFAQNPDSDRLRHEVRNFVRLLPSGLPGPDFVTDGDGSCVSLEWVNDANYLELTFGDKMHYYGIFEGRPEDGEFDLAKASDLIRRYAEKDEIDHDPFYGDGD